MEKLSINILNEIFKYLSIIETRNFLITSRTNYLLIGKINIFDMFIINNKYDINLDNINFFISHLKNADSRIKSIHISNIKIINTYFYLALSKFNKISFENLRTNIELNKFPINIKELLFINLKQNFDDDDIEEYCKKNVNLKKIRIKISDKKLLKKLLKLDHIKEYIIESDKTNNFYKTIFKLKLFKYIEILDEHPYQNISTYCKSKIIVSNSNKLCKFISPELIVKKRLVNIEYDIIYLKKK